MAESTIVKHLRDGTLAVIVGANSYTVKFEQGTLKATIPGPSVSNFLDRGRFGDFGEPPALRYNEDRPMTGSWDAYLRDLSDGTYITLPQFILRAGQYASVWGSSLGANAEVQTVDLLWTIAGPTHGDAAAHTVRFYYCTLEGSIEEGNPNKVALNFTSWSLYPVVT